MHSRRFCQEKPFYAQALAWFTYEVGAELKRLCYVKYFTRAVRTPTAVAGYRLPFTRLVRRRRPGDGRGGAQVERRQRGHFWSTFFEPREARPLCMLSTVSPI